MSTNSFDESAELIIILHFLLHIPMLIVHFFIVFPNANITFSIDFPIRTSGGAERKMENLKSYYFKILLERAFLKRAKMAADLCKSRLYSIVFQKMTQIWNSCASLGMELSVEHKAST